ncbi:SprT family zinc-dependent metalloprotease [Microbacterium sp. NPDC064584]|uniref:M48 family metallopeptidase n=1 Tax=Microbacterium sp. NPDC064584 TaxID=3155817 RepID=UPI00342429C3
MNQQLTVEDKGRRLVILVSRSDRSTLEIAVTPAGEVEVAAPLAATDAEIAARVHRRSRWIHTQLRYFDQFRPRTPTRRWVPGETHRYLGRPYRLRIGDTNASSGVTRTRGFLIVDGVSYDDSDGIRSTVEAWMRRESRTVFTASISRSAGRFVQSGVTPHRLIIRPMSARWGSMSPSGTLSINPALVQGSIELIDYVVTHELAHRIEPDHSARFVELMNHVMPDHAERKVKLERALA